MNGCVISVSLTYGNRRNGTVNVPYKGISRLLCLGAEIQTYNIFPRLESREYREVIVIVKDSDIARTEYCVDSQQSVSQSEIFSLNMTVTLTTYFATRLCRYRIQSKHKLQIKISWSTKYSYCTKPSVFSKSVTQPPSRTECEYKERYKDKSSQHSLSRAATSVASLSWKCSAEINPEKKSTNARMGATGIPCAYPGSYGSDINLKK